MADEPAASTGSEQEDGWLDKAAGNTWASAGILLVLWPILSFLCFLLVAFPTDSFTIALIAGPILGLAATGAIGHTLGLLERVDTARKRAPLWARLLLVIPVFAVLFLLSVVIFGPLIEVFVLMILAVVFVSAAATGAIVWFTGLLSDVPQRVRDSTGAARLIGLAAIGLASGLIGFLLGLMLLEEAIIGLAIFLPALILGAGVTSFFTGWGKDAKAEILEWHWGLRLLASTILLVLLTLYFALIIGPGLRTIAEDGSVLESATVGYSFSLVAALIVLLPVTFAVRTWRDLWASFVSLGEGNRVLAVLPIFPLSVALIFLAIVVLTSNFELAYVISLPAGLALFLLAGIPFGITQDIPGIVRKQRLPARMGIFLATFLLLALYAYFGIALSAQIVELAILAGMLLAGLVLGLLIWTLDLGEGLGEEFESYGALGEALILGLVFFSTLIVTFLAIGLALDEVRIAFLVSVLAAAGVNYLIAHTTGLITGMRATVAELPWWAEMAVIAAVFTLAFLYATIAIGTFLENVGLAFALGAVVGLVAVAALSRDLALGDDVLEAADEKRRARTVILVFAFLGGFLLGLYASAAALSAVGNDLFGFPFFIALLSGVATTIVLAQFRGWDEDVLARMRTTKDLFKVAVILAIWLGVGIFTGFALQSLPIVGEDIGLGTEAGLPLSLTLAAGLLLWAWIPVLLFRTVGVERTPVRATVQMREKPKLLASIAWGALTFIVALVVLLTLMDSPVLPFALSVVAGYLVALLISTRRRSKPSEDGGS